jgi:hypothetical protein
VEISALRRAAAMPVMDAGEQKWITVNGARIPIGEDGNPQNAAGKKIFGGSRNPEKQDEARRIVERATPVRKAKTLEEAREKAKAFVGEPLKNDETGLVGTVSGNNLGKMTSNSAVGKSSSAELHSLAVANADKLFMNAELDHSHPDKKGERTIKSIHRFSAPMITPNGEIAIVKITAKETTGPKEPNPIYSIEAVEVRKPARKAPSGEGIERVIGIKNDVATHPTGELSPEKVAKTVEKVNNAKKNAARDSVLVGEDKKGKLFYDLSPAGTAETRRNVSWSKIQVTSAGSGKATDGAEAVLNITIAQDSEDFNGIFRNLAALRRICGISAG